QEHLLKKTIDLISLGGIGRDRPGPLRCNVLELFPRVLGGLSRPAADDDVRLFLEEPHRGGQSDAARSAHDQALASLHSTGGRHGRSLGGMSRIAQSLT